jgi:hypothetical protein
MIAPGAIMVLASFSPAHANPTIAVEGYRHKSYRPSTLARALRGTGRRIAKLEVRESINALHKLEGWLRDEEHYTDRVTQETMQHHIKSLPKWVTDGVEQPMKRTFKGWLKDTDTSPDAKRQYERLVKQMRKRVEQKLERIESKHKEISAAVQAHQDKTFVDGWAAWKEKTAKEHDDELLRQADEIAQQVHMLSRTKTIPKEDVGSSSSTALTKTWFRTVSTTAQSHLSQLLLGKVEYRFDVALQPDKGIVGSHEIVSSEARRILENVIKLRHIQNQLKTNNSPYAAAIGHWLANTELAFKVSYPEAIEYQGDKVARGHTRYAERGVRQIQADRVVQEAHRLQLLGDRAEKMLGGWKTTAKPNLMDN